MERSEWFRGCWVSAWLDDDGNPVGPLQGLSLVEIIPPPEPPWSTTEIYWTVRWNNAMPGSVVGNN